MVTFTDFQLLSIFVGVLVGGIGIYKFVIKRPNLALDAYVVGDLDPEDQALVIFYVKNRGRRFADDVFVSMRTNDWELESVNDDLAEELLPSDVGISWRTVSFPPGSSAPNQEHKIHVDDPVYTNTEFQLAARIVPFEPGQIYFLDYLIACRSHQPRGGKIAFVVSEDGSVNVESKHSTLWKRIKHCQF